VLRVAIFAREKGPLGSAAEMLSRIEGITEVFTVTGKDDIIAMADISSVDELRWLREKLASEPSIGSSEIKVVTSVRKK